MRSRRHPQRKRLAFDERDVSGKRVLLHACCAPDSTVALEAWKPIASGIAVYFYNPNIHPEQESALRLDAMRKVAAHYRVPMVPLQEEDSAGCESALSVYADAQEGGVRCAKCFSLRLIECARMAQELDMDLFATTLTISPRKDHRLVNALGMEAGAEFGVDYIPTNFKKDDGFKRSVELSRELGIYRQRYCGCRWSAR